MAWLAEALQIVEVPEQVIVAAMRALMVGHQLGRVLQLNPPASDHLAREPITNEHTLTKALPCSRLVPLAGRLFCVPAARRINTNWSADPLPHRRETAFDAG